MLASGRNAPCTSTRPVPCRIVATLLSIVLPCFSTHAAEPVALVQTAQPILHGYPGVNATFLGVALGTSHDAARAEAIQLGQTKKGWVAHDETGTVSVGHDNAVITSRPYPAYLEIQTITGDAAPISGVMLWFGTPATGGTVTGMVRSTYYPDKSGPIGADATRSLVQSFGPYSATSRITLGGTGWQEKVYWVFGSSGLRPCKPVECDGADPRQIGADSTLGELEDKLKSGLDVLVTATISSDRDDPSRARQVVVFMEDVANEVLTLREARKQLDAAASR